MKKKTKLIIMGIVLLLLIGAVTGVVIHNKIVEANTPEEESSSIVYSDLFRTDVEKIQSITMTCGDDTYTLLPDGKTETGSIIWVMKEHPDWDLFYYVSSVVNMATSFSSYKYIQEDVTDPGRLDEFGLKDPVAIMKVKTTDDECEIHIGNLSSDREYAFCQIVGDDSIYACNGNNYKYATYTSLGLRQAYIEHTPDVEEGRVIELKAQKAGERPVEIYMDDDAIVNYVKGGATYMGTNLKFKEPYDNEALMVFTALQSEYFENLPAVEITDQIDPDCQDLDQYGLSLENPQYRETITTRKGTDENNYTYNTTDYVFGYTYMKGDVTYIYFREADSTYVYGVNADCMEGRLFTPFEFVNKLMYLELITNVESGSVTVDGETTEFSILRQELDEEAGITEENRLSAYYINDTLVEEETFTYFYRMLISVAPDYEIIGEEPITDSSDTCTFTLNLVDGSSKTITYERMSEFYYVTQVGDDTWFATSTSYIDDIREALASAKEAINAQ